jgi:hypothetical protein
MRNTFLNLPDRRSIETMPNEFKFVDGEAIAAVARIMMGMPPFSDISRMLSPDADACLHPLFRPRFRYTKGSF